MTEQTSIKTGAIVLVTAGIMILIFFLQSLFPVLDDMLALKASEFFQEPWTILTAGFAHGSPSHLYGNLFFLVLFGIILERLLGAERFVYLLLSAIVIANISAFFFYTNTNVLGASGAVSTFLVALAVFQPRMVGIYFGIPMRMWAVLFFWLLLNLIRTAGETNVAAEAHLFGGVFGLAVGLYLRRHGYQRPQPSNHKKKEPTDISEEDIDRWEERHMR